MVTTAQRAARSLCSGMLCALTASLLVGDVHGAAAQACWARSCTVTNAVHVRVGTVLRLSVAGATTVLATADATVIGQGGQAAAGPVAVVRSNGRWRLEISAAQPVWTPAATSARPDKPAADLTWSIDPAAPFSQVGTEPRAVATGGPTDGRVLPLYYRTRFSPASDTPGTYALTVRLTLVGA